MGLDSKCSEEYCRACDLPARIQKCSSCHSLRGRWLPLVRGRGPWLPQDPRPLFTQLLTVSTPCFGCGQVRFEIIEEAQPLLACSPTAQLTASNTCMYIMQLTIIYGSSACRSSCTAVPRSKVSQFVTLLGPSCCCSGMHA